jgi:hypothetical protein
MKQANRHVIAVWTEPVTPDSCPSITKPSRKHLHAAQSLENNHFQRTRTTYHGVEVQFSDGLKDRRIGNEEEEEDGRGREKEKRRRPAR